MAEVLPRFPADVTIVRARRGAASGDAKKQNRLYAVRRKKVMGSTQWLMEKNHYYADVVSDPTRIADIVDGAEIPGVSDMDPGNECLPDDMGPAPDQVSLSARYLRPLSRLGGCSSPK